MMPRARSSSTAPALGIADRATVLELGRVVLEDSAEAIAADARVQEAYLGS